MHRGMSLGKGTALAAAACALLAAPAWMTPVALNLAIVIFYYCIVAQSWNLLAGCTGQFSMGHQAFVALGAYSTGLACHYLHVPPAAGIALAAVVSTAVGLLLAAAVMRLAGSYLALATWAFGLTLQVVLMGAYEFTRGDRGLVVPSLLGQLRDLVPYYYVFLGLAAVSLGAMFALLRSPIGLLMRAVRDDALRATSLGVDVVKVKTLAFALSSFFCGLAGAFYAHFTAVTSPSAADFTVMGLIIAMVMIGGMGTFAGPILGAVIVACLNNLLQEYGQLNVVIYALVMIFIVRFYRDGLVAAFRSAWERLGRRLRRERDGKGGAAWHL